ncbi:ABC transporter ATP-binding protein [Schleiferilactobacillus perolens]|jgi:ATP-binding cassette subfamily B protein|uniref:ABC transporter ATP-binding protein n=1 Tax=Schleiferilactobacillus perolens TaxID=100468 RepID=UPI0023525909|nr:ABC transporter ATP-binding protein [Schleiferilactobacillus perolens]MCI2170730.1 ABC transporter ATP-binding protein/permease [Schleiferilactobacillus perolens]
MIKLMKSRMSIWAILGAILFMTGQVVANLFLPNLTADIVNKGIANGDVNYIWQTGMRMLLVTLVAVLSATGNVFLASRASQQLGQKLRSDLYHKVLYYSNDQFDQIGTSSLITRTTNDVVQIQNVTMMMLRMMIMAPITLVGASFLAYSKDAYLTRIFLVVIPVLVIVMGGTMFFAVPLFKKMQTKTDRLNLIFREGLTGVRVIRAFRRDAFEQNRFDVANKDYTQNARRVFSIIAVLFPLVTLIMSGTNIGIVWFGAQRIASQSMETGNMIAFITYAMQILMSFMMLAMVFFFVPRAQASATRINQVLDAKTTLTSPTQTEEQKSATASLDFNNVQFRYAQAENPALTGVDFHAATGQTVAIIGGTGSGKTTLVNLISRFYDVEKGDVDVNGTDVRSWDLSDLHRHVAFVPQKSVLFRGTIRSNMLYGNEQATDEQIWHALDIAQATEFVKGLSAGLDAVVEQGGNNFSGGQKQRLAIARALVKPASIYVFDDSFSALDFKTDANLRAALHHDTQMQQSVVVIVGQRVSTVADADTIIVLDSGKMVGRGTHQELLANNKTYQEIVSSQIRKGETHHE